ncbi:hypothetical protein QQ045_029889 [Rhodiola kirilowii]
MELRVARYESRYIVKVICEQLNLRKATTFSPLLAQPVFPPRVSPPRRSPPLSSKKRCAEVYALNGFRNPHREIYFILRPAQSQCLRSQLNFHRLSYNKSHD